jgi:acetolactate synthase-1/2/3 large subunit
MTGFWGTALVNQTCLDADLVLAIGTRFKEADSSSWYRGYTFDIPGSKLIHIDIEPSEIGRNFPVDLGVVADARAALDTLTRAAKRLHPDGRSASHMVARIAEARREFAAANRAAASSSEWPMLPERILADTRAIIPSDAFLTTDVGWNKNGVGQQFPILEPGTFLTPGGFATMGFGPAAAVGVKLARPDRTVIALVGDGGFGQNPAVLATAVEHRLGVVWVVMNNNAFGTIAGLQKAHFGTTYGTTFPGEIGEALPDYAAIAEAYGAVGIRVGAADEYRNALERAIKLDRPVVIDVPMRNTPTPTTGHWNILDIYSPDRGRSHVATD